MLSDSVIALLGKGLWETIYMTFVSGFFFLFWDFRWGSSCF